MKIAVLNFSGNVGKTTIAKNLLLPRLPDTPYLAIETINDDGANGDDIKVKGKNYDLVQDELIMNDNLIVDIGSSNVEQALSGIAKLHGSHNSYDYFLLPSVPSLKEQIDTNATMIDLLELGVDAEKIRLVFNKVEEPDEFTKDFEKVINQAQLFNIRIPKVAIQENEIYSRLREIEISMPELLAIDDLRAKVKQATDDKKRRLARLYTSQMLAKTAKKNLDNVFADLALETSEA